MLRKGKKKPPKSEFGKDATADEVTSLVSLKGKTVLITGANSGIGFESMRVLSKHGAHIVGTARTFKKADDACACVAGEATPLACDLSNLHSVAECAAEIAERGIKLDGIMCNAGIMGLHKLQQKDGLELHFLTNHLGHFYLVTELLENLKESRDARIVLVSSAAHARAPKEGIQFENLTGEKGYSALRAYGQSKLANALFAAELARRLEGTSVTANSVHPGVVMTNIARNLNPVLRSGFDMFGPRFAKSVQQGAATQCYVMSHPKMRGVSGFYLADCNNKKPNKLVRDEALAKRLWDVSEAECRRILGAEEDMPEAEAA